MDIKSALANWTALNDALRDATEGEAEMLLKAEVKGVGRLGFVIRIHHRFNKLRSARELRELSAKTKR